MIRWFAVNGIAANFLMLSVLGAGFYTALYRVPLEVDPARSRNMVIIDMPYRGATAKDVERAILIPIEEALEGVDGIELLEANGSLGNARLFLRAEPGFDPRALMDDVKARVDAITTFPNETERPQIFVPESSQYWEVLNVAVTGNVGPHELRRAARRVQEDLLELPGISRAAVEGDRRFEISVEADVRLLLAYGLSLQDLAEAIRLHSIDLPAGVIDSESGSFVVRTTGQAYTQTDFAEIPIRAADGAEVRLGEIAVVRDGFEEGEKRVEFNGRPALFVEVMRVGNENAIEVSDRVRDYVKNSRTRFPEGIDLHVWDDESVRIRERLSTLGRSVVQGAVLVIILLGLFLRPALAFGIVVGIPVGFAGGALVMHWFDITANAMSLFGYIIVVGIVVDDAIVTGENIYSKIQTGMPPLEAAVEGTHEVATPVTFGALTTMVAFIPLLFFEGRWGDYAKQIPPVVAGVLLFSLIESKLILPSHLKHIRRQTGQNVFARLQFKIANCLERIVQHVYQPVLLRAVRQRFSVVAGFVAIALIMAGYCVGGRMAFVSFPAIDTQRMTARLALPGDTTLMTTTSYMDRIEAALEQLRQEYVDPVTGESVVRNVVRVTGASRPGRDYDKTRGYLSFEIMSPNDRSVPGPRNDELANRWSELIGPIPEASSFRIASESRLNRYQEYDDENINIELRGPSSPAKAEIAEEIKRMLESYDGIRSAWARVNYGQDELALSLKPRAAELGVTQAMLARQIRQAFFGEEAQRVQRGVDDIRVMVRLPEDQRESLHTLDRMKIRTPRGADVPLATIADISFTKAPSYVERNDRAEIIRCGGQPVDDTVDVIGIAEDMTPRLTELCRSENLSFQFLGYVAEAEQAKKRTILGAVALLFTLYGILAIALKSLIQPIFVMLVVPFAVIGALLGHIVMDITPSYLSVFGMLALSGIAVNDTLVMVDYVNRRLRQGVTIRNAALEAGSRRFRPIVLTSVTTFAGLTPLMLETSLQAQSLIPMAVSLAYGVLFATGVTLFLGPCALIIADDLTRAIAAAGGWYWRPFQELRSRFDTPRTLRSD